MIGVDRRSVLLSGTLRWSGALIVGKAVSVLLKFGWAEVVFGLVGGGRHTEVLSEAQHVDGSVAHDFQQETGFAFAGTAAVAGRVGQPDQHPITESLCQFCFDLLVDGGAALAAGHGWLRGSARAARRRSGQATGRRVDL